MRAAVAKVDPGLPLSRATPYEALLGDSEARTRLTARLLAAFALTALLLGCLGVYGVAAQAVRERTREIGVRMALGAGAGPIVSAVLREGLLLTVPGVLVGLAGAAAATRLLEGMLVGVRASGVRVTQAAGHGMKVDARPSLHSLGRWASTALPTIVADVRTETVKAKNGPKSRVAAMLVMNRPGTLACRDSSSTGWPSSVCSSSSSPPRARNGIRVMSTW